MSLGSFAITSRASHAKVITKDIPEVTHSERQEIEFEAVQKVFGCEKEELTRQSISLSAQRGIEVQNIDEHIDNLVFDPDQDGCESIKSQSSCRDETDPFGTPVPNCTLRFDQMIEDIELEMKSEPEDFLSSDLRQKQKSRPILQPFCFSEQASPERDLFLRMSAPLPKPISNSKSFADQCCFSDSKGLEQGSNSNNLEFLQPAEVVLCRHNSQTCQPLSRDHSRSRLLSEPIGTAQAVNPLPELVSQPSCEGDPSITSSTTGSAKHKLEVDVPKTKFGNSEACSELPKPPNCF